ncbi:hypothetical protein N7540_012554 [Penicillium herquei]|nr:hypothetical protein N7540_012554 [Penicillium herquei]
MSPPLPSLTEVWHNDTYSEISPLRPDLSAAKKTVIITGAGSGIGRACALAFARAGAAMIVLIGRTEEKLRETQQLLSCSSSIHAVSTTDEKGMKDVAATTRSWDVLVLAAGYQPEPSSIQETSIDDWWQSFETNVKGTMIPSKVFLPSANPVHSSIIAFTSAVVFPPTMLVNLSAYVSSKLSVIKFIEYLAAENPSTFAVALSPGMVDTAMLRKSGANPNTLPLDTDSPEASFLNGRNVWANWDVNELKSKAENIKSGLLLTSGVYGWPFNADF